MYSMYMLLTYSGPINKFYSDSDDQKRSLIGCHRPIGGESCQRSRVHKINEINGKLETKMKYLGWKWK